MDQERLGNGLGDPNGLSLPMTTLTHIKNSRFEISPADRTVLRELAKKVAELAARPEEKAKRELWYKHNDLEKARPLVYCDPENGWYEIIPHQTLKCGGPLARIWEFRLRKEIFWAESMKDDRVTEDKFRVQYVFDETYFGLNLHVIAGEDLDGAYTWEPALPDYANLKNMRFREMTVDLQRSKQLFDLAQETVGDILRVIYDGCFWWSLGMTWDLANMRGMEQMMADMYENPADLHKLMALFRDDHLHRLDLLEKNGLLTLNNEGEYVGSGGSGWTKELPQKDFDGKHVRTMDMWGFAESQETIGVSPQMFNEFILPYQIPLLARFGLNCYGCCEPVDKRWEYIVKIPRLRRVSVSAWANIHDMAERLGDRYIYSWKPRPSDLAFPSIDKDAIRSYIRETVKAAKGCNLEIIMKDNHTIGNNPQNVIDWTRIAMEEAGAV